MRSWVFIFVLGVFCANLQASLLNVSFLIGLILISILFIILATRKQIRFFFIAPCIMVVGFCYCSLFAHWQLRWSLPAELQSKPVQLRGVIASIPLSHPLSTNFIFYVKELQSNSSITYPGVKVHLSWYNAPSDLKPGDEWRVTAKLKRNHGFADAGAFDSEYFSFVQGIRAGGYVVNKDPHYKIKHDKFSALIDNWRFYINQQLQTILQHSSLPGVIPSLVTGSHQQMSHDQWLVLQRTGTVHLLIIAGLHIGFAVGLVYWTTKKLWSQNAFLVQRIPAPIFAASCSIVIAFIYSALAGFSIPTQRALVMVVVFMGAQCCRRWVSPGHSIIIALFVIVLLNPIALLLQGFWLSFCAVAIIFYVTVGRVPLGNWWKKWGRIQLGLTFGLLPCCLFFFQQSSLVSAMANGLAVPLFGLIIAPLSLCGSFILLFFPWLGKILILTANLGIEWFWPVLVGLAKLPLASWQHAVLNSWVLCSSSIGILLLLAPFGWPSRWLGLIWLLPLFYFKVPSPTLGEFDLTLLDVGQGLSVVIRTAQHTLVFDAGPKQNEEYDAGLAVVLPFLATQQVTRVDTLVISHGDNDHRGGAKSILEQLSVTQIKSSVPQLFKHQNASYCLRGQAWEWEGVSFQFLSPFAMTREPNNNDSCVLLVSNGIHHVLLTGDIEQEAEEQLVSTNDLPKIDILVAPHHGSKTSSSLEFVTMLEPKIVLFATGYLNRYHFPSPIVINRYQLMHAQLWNTSDTGSLTFNITKNKFINPPSIYRQAHHYFWQDG